MQYNYAPVMGDLEEEFECLLEESGLESAKRWYRWQVVKSIPACFSHIIYWNTVMLKNYLKIAVRNFQRYKVHSFINITGLAVAFACSLLIMLHVKEELSYDKGFSKAERIFRIKNSMLEGNNWRYWAQTSPLLGLQIQSDIPEIEQVARFRYISSRILSYVPVGSEPVQFEESGGFFADQDAISMFDLQFIKGNPQTALTELNTIVLTFSMAERYFGKKDPLGKTIMMNNASRPLKVTGVIKDIPFNTHLQFDYLVSIPTFYALVKEVGQEALLNNKTWAALYTYVLLNTNQTQAQVEAKLPDFLANFLSERGSREEILANVSYHLQPITDIHLHSKLESEIGPNSDIAYVYIFSAIAFFILLIAGVNFVNISNAQALKRMKEVGVRKLLGAHKRQLIKQFLCESVLLAFAAAIAAILLFQIAIPFYNELSGKSLSIMYVLSAENISLIIFIVASIGILAGFYPAFFISNFQPANSIKGLKDPQSSVSVLRRCLVIFQFVVSVFMIFSTIIIYEQMVYFRSKDLGFDKENVIAMKLGSDLKEEALKNPEALKTELLRHSAISSVSAVSDLPGEDFSIEPLMLEGVSNDEGQPQLRFLRADEDFIKTLNIEIIKGRSFSERTLNSTAFILNESAVKALNLEEPVGQIATTYFRARGEIIGMVKDFNFASLHNAVEPLVIEYMPVNSNIRSLTAAYLLVRIQGNDFTEVLAYIRTKIKEIAPNDLFLYSFLENDLNLLYKAEDRMSDVFKIFALFAILISCLGLFGLSTYSAELRVKEIGVRKVLGASLSSIVLLLSKEIVRWMILANIIALPIAWFAMNNWLQNFAYRINIGISTFILSVVLSLVTAWLTLSYQSIKAALANPVDALKYE